MSSSFILIRWYVCHNYLLCIFINIWWILTLWNRTILFLNKSTGMMQGQVFCAFAATILRMQQNKSRSLTSFEDFHVWAIVRSSFKYMFSLGPRVWFALLALRENHLCQILSSHKLKELHNYPSSEVVKLHQVLPWSSSPVDASPCVPL